MTMASQGTSNAVDDPSQSDWAKHKSLKEIELIRETKKDSVLNSVLNDYVVGVK